MFSGSYRSKRSSKTFGSKKATSPAELGRIKVYPGPTRKTLVSTSQIFSLRSNRLVKFDIDIDS